MLYQILFGSFGCYVYHCLSADKHSRKIWSSCDYRDVILNNNLNHRNKIYFQTSASLCVSLALTLYISNWPKRKCITHLMISIILQIFDLHGSTNGIEPGSIVSSVDKEIERWVALLYHVLKTNLGSKMKNTTRSIKPWQYLFWCCGKRVMFGIYILMFSDWYSLLTVGFIKKHNKLRIQ